MTAGEDEEYVATNPPCADEWESPFAESIRDWLLANGVNWNHVCAWPEIKVDIDPEGVLFQVEMFYRNKDDKLELMRGLGDSALTTMNTFRHKVRIDPELLAAYQHSYQRTHSAGAVTRAAVERFLLHHPPAIRVHEGSSLVWVIENQLDGPELTQMLRQLEAILPGVAVSLVSGVHAVFAGPGKKGS